jgi:hypothetical protein
LFVPFHYGWWDAPGRIRAANELTRTAWDPVSKQPQFKQAAARLRKIEAYTSAPPEERRKRDETGAKEIARRAKKKLGLTRPHLADYLGYLEECETQLAQAAASLRERHPREPEIQQTGGQLERWALQHLADLRPLMDRYGTRRLGEGRKLRQVLLTARKPGGYGLVRDLHDLWVLSQGPKIAVVVLLQAARALRDPEFGSLLDRIAEEHERQSEWILTKLKQSAAQALVVPS